MTKPLDPMWEAVSREVSAVYERLDQQMTRAIEDGHNPIVVRRAGARPAGLATVYVADASQPEVPLYE